MSGPFRFTLGNPSKLQNSRPRWNDGVNQRAINRNVLRRGFGNEDIHALGVSPQTFAAMGGTGGLSPFRISINAGDIVNTHNKAVNILLPRPPSQVHVRSSSLAGWKMSAGAVQQRADGGAYSGNPKFVYDGSDYTRFKKLQAINRNYYDPTFGGDQNSASQSAIRGVRS